MTMCNCNCRPSCPILALVLSAILGVLAAFFEITGVITVTTTFLWVVFGIAVVYLAVLVVTTALMRRCESQRCICPALQVILAGILGAILAALILLAVGIVATSVLNAILVGLLVFFFVLILTGSACLVQCMADCQE